MTFRDQTDCPELSGPGIFKKKSRTFQEVWEPGVLSPKVHGGRRHATRKTGEKDLSSFKSDVKCRG